VIAVGRRVGLRRPTVGDLGLLQAIDFSCDRDTTWRLGGAVPPPNTRVALLWSATVSDQRVLVIPSTGATVGYATFYDFDGRNGVGWIAVATAPSFRRTGVGILGTALFVETVFSEWPARILYLEATEETLDAFESIAHADFTEKAARYRDKVRRPDGSTIDSIVLAIPRESWAVHVGRRLRAHILSDEGHM
jgi:hypothetical protein